jgi:hypothetical protein
MNGISAIANRATHVSRKKRLDLILGDFASTGTDQVGAMMGMRFSFVRKAG